MQLDPHARCPLCGHCAHLHELFPTGEAKADGETPVMLLGCYGCSEVCKADTVPEIRRAILATLFDSANTELIKANGL